MSEFVRVARAKDIPAGEGRVFAVNGRTIAVFNVAGRFHAIENACAHQQGPLGEGDLEGCVVTCPWHGWTYDVTTGQSPDDDGCVGRFDTKVTKGELFVAVPAAEVAAEAQAEAATEADPAAESEETADSETTA